MGRREAEREKKGNSCGPPALHGLGESGAWTGKDLARLRRFCGLTRMYWLFLLEKARQPAHFIQPASWIVSIAKLQSPSERGGEQPMLLDRRMMISTT